MRIIYSLIFVFFFSCTNNRNIDFVPFPKTIAPVEINPLPIGSSAPDFHLPGVDGKFYNLEDFKSKKLLAVLFLSNHCPFAQVYEDQLKRFVNDFEEHVAVTVISPNSPRSIPDDALGYSDLDDSYHSMQLRASHKGFNYPYLYDGDDQKVTIAYGASVVPFAMLFDQKRKLVYKGNLDPSPNAPGGNLAFLRSAVNATIERRSIIRPDRFSYGCDIYWSWDKSEVKLLEKEWQNAPIQLQKINLDSLKTIMVNFSPNLRVINFWATWCGPCKKEFPELMKMKRMYRHRPVEFITVSLDGPEKYDDALTFLKQLHVPGQNYFLDEENIRQINVEINENWKGTLPYTLILEPLGQIYREFRGPFDPYNIRRALIEHPNMGRTKGKI